MKTTNTFVFFLCLFIGQTALSQSADEKLVKDFTSNLTSETRGDKMIEIGKKFLGRPYIGGTLEAPKEALICRLDGFDCYTFVETMLAMVLTSEYDDTGLDNLKEEIQYLRYRDGEINGYASRVHYFFEWAKLAEKNGVVTDLTPELGEAAPKPINFMSTHRQYYPAFKTNDAVWNQIKTMEKAVSRYEFHEIKKENLADVAEGIQNGDILAFTSNIGGLDVNHEGLAYWKGDQLHFMHASSEEKKIVISDETLQSYLDRIKKHSGLMVLRVNEDSDL
ncbi:N-acetylmuramoyl-L-alanine amidase-like domain-containing protein [uncultured Arcticibacterium sp.]|uniref:N-acetylmuramoyl-L-alanine amidase-like domain-containing protein n=1 Tax=uncultured Arcticibacterium sp. TaxID=2173042 RepID=UPI0030F9793D